MGSHEKSGRWYVKKDDKVQGPFPNQLIASYLILGRMTLETEVSQDQEHWVAVKEYRALVPEVVLNAHTKNGAKALKLARIREDERISLAANPDESATERRIDEDQVIKLHRQLRDDILNRYKTQPELNTQKIAIGMVIIVVVVIAYVFIRPASELPGADCSALPAAGVNWSSCNKQGQNLAGQDLTGAIFKAAHLNGVDFTRSQLSGADFSYANLFQAELAQSKLTNALFTGANLRKANLQGADLRGADLSYSELEGARLDGALLAGARFDNAIWLNGEQCLPESIGACLLPK